MYANVRKEAEMVMPDTLGERIQNALDVRGMTQADLARKTGMSTGLIAQIVSGRTKDPHFMNVVKISRALDVSLDYLAGWDKRK